MAEAGRMTFNKQANKEPDALCTIKPMTNDKTDKTDKPNMLENALKLANSGFVIFPCRPDKTPLIKAWPTKASAESEIISNWWQQHPSAMIGLPTGHSSGVLVIDLDIDKITGEPIGEKNLKALGYSDLLKTVQAVETPSGGLHLYFKHVNGLRNTTSKLGEKIDTRADGGYAIAPGSANTFGLYKARETLDLKNLPELPQGLVKLLTDQKSLTLNVRPVTHILNDQVNYVRRAPEGTRNNTLNRSSFILGQHLASGKLSEETVSTGLYSAALETGLSKEEAIATIRSGINAGASNSQKLELNIAAPAWEEPHQRFLRDEVPPAPELPLERIICPELAKWILDSASAKGAPADYVFSALLSAAGSLIGNSRWASPWPGWQEPPIVWTMCIGLPSSGKSPAIDAVLQPLRKLEKPLRDAARIELERWEETVAVAKISEIDWKVKAKKALESDETPPEKPASAKPDPQPHSPRLLLNDSTIEKLAAIISAQPKGILQARDELAGWLESMTRYAGGGTDRPFWLEAYGGRGYTVERINREALSIDRLSVSVVGGIQPDRLYQLLFKSADDGLLARFIPIWPESVPPVRPISWADESFVERMLQRLIDLKMKTNERDEVKPWLMRFTEEACNRLDAFRLKTREWEGISEGLMVSFVGKLSGLVVRISLVLAFLDYASKGGEKPTEITEEYFGKAEDFVENYLLPMAQRAYANASVQKDEKASLKLVALIREKEWKQFSVREVLRLNCVGLSRKEELDPAINILDQADCIRKLQVSSGPKGGRQKRIFEVNPSVLLLNRASK